MTNHHSSGPAAADTTGDGRTRRLPPQVLQEYALLADGQRGAVIGPRGDLAWLCAPFWDSDPVFDSLVGGRGVYAITPARPRLRVGRLL